MFVLRAVIVNRDLDVVLFHEFAEFRKRGLSRSAHHQGRSQTLRIFKLAADVCLVVLLQIYVPDSHNDDAGSFEFFLRRIDLLRRAIERQVKALYIEIGRLQLLGHLDRLGAREFPE